MSCPCGRPETYEECCGPYHRGDAVAATPEALMRSRYAAFVRGEIDYIVSTHHPKSRGDLDVEGVKSWAEGSEWLGLEVLGAETKDDRGLVEFVASYKSGNEVMSHHEQSRFAKVDGVWFYEDGDIVRPKPVVNEAPKIGRNEPCPCGSAKKYKKCCGR